MDKILDVIKRKVVKGTHLPLTIKEPPLRQLRATICLNYRSMSRLSMDLKVMPKWQKGQCYILCVIDEMTNYLVTAPIYQAKSEEIGDTLIENVISKFGTP